MKFGDAVFGNNGQNSRDPSRPPPLLDSRDESRSNPVLVLGGEQFCVYLAIVSCQATRTFDFIIIIMIL